MPFRDFGDNLNKIGEKVIEYGEYRLEYYKLFLYKAIVKIARSLFIFFILGGIILITFIFLSLGASILIGDALGNPAYGFLIVGGFFLLLLLFVVAFGKKIIERLIFKISYNWFEDDSEKRKGIDL